MSRRFTIVTVALTSVVAFLLGLILAAGLAPAIVVSTAPSAPKLAVSSAPSRPAVPPPVVHFSDIVPRINAAVVNIDATSKNTRELRRREDLDGFGREFDGPRQGSGSGFLIDKNGYILTNFHVIDGAERITVTLADGRALRAEVAGTDPAIDVALLKINGESDLPFAPLGNSDDLRVGEWVCAIGNPLGYNHSVTVGVVSFIGRKLYDASLDAYIQTDAAINFGNSGGPLINSSGQVIGINSAISARASSIGFAVPINQAAEILDQLKTRGRVSRGFIGVELRDVTPALQQSLHLTVSNGAVVQDVKAASPAERAGLQVYDVIVEVEGQKILDNEELIRHISSRQPGTVARLGVVREGRQQTLQVKLAERPLRSDETTDALGDGLGTRRRPPEPDPADGTPLGINVRELDRNFMGRLEIPATVHGVVIAKVDPTGPGFQALLRRGLVIMEINRRAVRSVADYQRIVSAVRPGDILALYVYDATIGQRSIVTVTAE